MSIDHLFLARVLFTLTTAGWAVATVIADFNKTHATNPKWTPHARFHVVWQISSYVGFGLLAFALIWWPGPLALERLYLVAAMGVIVYAAFFTALLTMPIYGGSAYDTNGYKPFKAPIPVISNLWDVNVTIFSIQVLLLAGGITAVQLADPQNAKPATSRLCIRILSGTRAGYSTNTSSRLLRIIGRAAITSNAVATAISPAEIGRVRNTVASPRAINMARRRFSSINGPSTKASTSGAGSNSCLFSQ